MYLSYGDLYVYHEDYPDSKVHGANMDAIRVLYCEV